MLIGNSRWHWASGRPDQLHCTSTNPQAGAAALADPHGPPLRAWAAVGALPPALVLPPRQRLATAAVPLHQLPPWLGVDRALAAWLAWRRSGAAVLVVDAGTALTFTRVDGTGAFAGGRIQAGRGLQLRALASGTAALPALPPAPGPCPDPWPRQTAAAMEAGVRAGLVAAVAAAWQEERQANARCRLWITGGDGGWLGKALDHPSTPHLALEGLVTLATAGMS